MTSDTSALSETGSSHNWYYVHHNISGFGICVFLAIFMTTWPWIFFGALKRSGGLQLDRTSTMIAHENPKDTTFFLTAICGIISLILGFLHSAAVAKIATKQIILKNTTISLISFFVALKDRKLGLPVFSRVKPGLLLIVGLYVGVFMFATPAFTALLMPAPFNRTVHLTGWELDFASNDIDCIDWFNNNIIPSMCDWIASVRPL
jgi:hypothetical protein